MGRSFEEKPDTWADWSGKIKHVGGDVYYTIVEHGIEVGGTGYNVWVWHWHRPTTGAPERWEAAGCANHTVQQVEPLTLSPSLACYDGCPSHGFIENGVWRSV